MVDDARWELAILATVQGFHEKLLEDWLGGEVLLPPGLEATSLQQAEGDVHETLARMRRWLRLLDLATTPAMLRRAFTSDTDPEIAEAMLRYFTRKKDPSDVNRDKTDLLATFLYRHPRVPGQWERRGFGLDGSLPLSPFEIALIEILADSEVPSLPESHVQLLRRFDPLQQEAQGFRDLHTLLDSGIIVRVRELKQSLDLSFYHPGVLATVAAYNVVFGRKFDQLFHAATAEIKSFAEALAEQGGSILGTVDGVDVTVDHIAAMEENELLKIDYSAALEKFHRVSKLKKVLEHRPPLRRVARLLVAARAKASRAGAVQSPPASSGRPLLDVEAMRSAVTPQQISTEESKLRKVEESIRVFVRLAGPRFRQVVPMRSFNLPLTSAEANAYCADYLEEKSLRADVARVLLRSVALMARLTAELEELKRGGNSASLGKLHVGSLLALLEVARGLAEKGGRVMALAGQQGSAAEAGAVKLSLENLRDRAHQVVRALGRGEGQAAGA